MKYFLSTAGKKCCKGCTWLLSLARNEEGYDLIQFKRGLSEHKHLMKLYPGEPAVVLDTGEFYIGDANGSPILINPDGAALPDTGCVLSIRNQPRWSQGAEVIVPYADLITSDGEPVGESDAGRYSCAIIINDNNLPVGVAFLTDWGSLDTGATFIVGYFNQLVEFNNADIDAIITRAEAKINS